VPVRKWGIAAAFVIGVAAVFLYLVAARPPLERWSMTKVFIPKGSTLPEIEKTLTEKGVVRYPLAFRILVIGSMSATKLRHGEYAFPAPPSGLEVLEKLVSGDVAKYQVTIPEGSTLFDIAQILGNLELAEPAEFLETARSPALPGQLGIPAGTLEGFLFPDTYLFVKDMTAAEIIGVLVHRFRRKFTPEMEEKAEEAGFTLEEIVTIASIIEKETGMEEEKPLVSAVIRNRLSLGMPLQMDPTVIYGLRKVGGSLTKKDLRKNHPYNTYLNLGLPPGPISNPGLTSLIAAVDPADADYLYFVSRNDGSHQFSRTLREHNEAVATYRKGKRAKPARGSGTAERGDGGAGASTPPLRP
jgi:UPF0755 protein